MYSFPQVQSIQAHANEEQGYNLTISMN